MEKNKIYRLREFDYWLNNIYNYSYNRHLIERHLEYVKIFMSKFSIDNEALLNISRLNDFKIQFVESYTDAEQSSHARAAINRYMDYISWRMRTEHFILDKPIYKVSHGFFINDTRMRKLNLVDEFEKKNWIVVHSNTGHGQGDRFKNECKIGDLVYVCIGGHMLSYIAKIISQAAPLPDSVAQRIGQDGWIFREVTPLYFPVQNKLEGLKAQNLGWLPSGNTTFFQVPFFAYNDANKLIFHNYYGLSLSKISERQNGPITSTTDSMKNKILYGPPGTGKTHELKTKYFSEFTVRRENTNDVDLSLRIRKHHWWQVIAAALTQWQHSTVPELAKNNLIQTKHRPSSDYPQPNHIIWSELQRRSDLFSKEDDSRWVVNKKVLEDNYPDVIELASLQHGASLKLEKSERENYSFVTFHQSYSYEDFIEGIKPVIAQDKAETSQLSYEIKTGLFYELCLKAIQMAGYKSFIECYEDDKLQRSERFKLLRNDPEKRVAIFIDEINRGNVSAIFGELISLIEEDKRIGEDNELWVDLPYSREKFGVPPNLFIIGTMNTADRSVEALDTALRRRFEFKEMLPKSKLLDPSAMICRMMWNYEKNVWEDPIYENPEKELFNLLGISDQDYSNRKVIWEQMEIDNDRQRVDYFAHWIPRMTGINLSRLLDTINVRIEALIDRDHTIGHAYFMSVGSLAELQHTFARNIVPLLQEYFYGDYEKMAMVIGPGFFRKEQPDVVFALEESRIRPNGSKWQLKNVAKMETSMFGHAIRRLLDRDYIMPKESESDDDA